MLQKNLLFFITCLMFVVNISFAQQASKNNTQATFPSASQFANSNFSYKIIPSAEQTFGYDILADQKLMIHQPTIPGMPGNKGFKSEAAAQKIAELVIGKIKNGEMPPTVSVEEVKEVE